MLKEMSGLTMNFKNAFKNSYEIYFTSVKLAEIKLYVPMLMEQ